MRTRRLSGAAIRLLTRMYADDATIRFVQLDGVFHLLTHGGAPEFVHHRTVEVLAGCRLISKDPSANGNGPRYTITERGLSVLHQMGAQDWE